MNSSLPELIGVALVYAAGSMVVSRNPYVWLPAMPLLFIGVFLVLVLT